MNLNDLITSLAFLLQARSDDIHLFLDPFCTLLRNGTHETHETTIHVIDELKRNKKIGCPT